MIDKNYIEMCKNMNQAYIKKGNNMKYDKSLKDDKDKKSWNFLQSGVFSDTRDKCIELKKQGYTKKEIVDMFRPMYEYCEDALKLRGIRIWNY